MDTIKNILSSNQEKNDAAPHGSGRELGSTNNSGAFSGEGAHLAESHHTSAGTGTGFTGNQASGLGSTSEGSHLARAHDTPVGAGSGLAGNQTSGVTNTSSAGGPNPLARDAAVAASGVGVTEHEYRKHENERGLGSTTTGQGIGNTQGTGYTQGVGTHGTGHQPSQADDLPIAASMGAGSTGMSQGSSYYTGPTGTAVQGPHSTDTANRLDPAINTSGTTRLEDAHEHLERHGGGAEEADKHHSDKIAGSGQTSNTHHLGRDTAIGGGIGAAAYVADKHHHQSQAKDQDTFAGQSHPVTATSTTTTTNISAPQTYGTAHQTNPVADNNTTKDHHYGRDAAVGAGAGVGAAGLAEHEHHKRASEYYPRDPVDDSKTSSIAQGSAKDPSLLSGPAPNTAGPHKKDWMNKLDPFVDSHPCSKTTDADILALPVRQGQGSVSEQTIDQDGKHLPRSDVGEGSGADSHYSGDQKSHHYGRDAAAAGVVGGTAYEADEHHREHESNTLAQPSHSTATRQPTTTTTTNPQSSLGESNNSKDHHYGRDAAIAGGVGGTAYEAEKHHKHDKDLTQAERDAKKEQKHEAKEAKKEHKHEAKEEKRESKGGLLGFLHRDKNKKYTPEEDAEFDRQEREHHASHKERDTAAAAGAGVGAGALYGSDKHQYAGQNTGTTTGTGAQDTTHHYGRDATLGGGAVGAAGIAEHEHDKHSGPTPLAEKPKGKDIGDILHGVERNRGVPGSSGFPGTEGFGTGTGGALAAKDGPQSERSEATTDQSGAALPLDLSPEHGARLTGQHQKTDSGYAAGGNNYQTGQYDASPGSGLSGSQNTDHSSAVPRTTGLATDNEYRKQDTTSGLMGSNIQSGFTGSDSTTSGVNEGSDGRNRLHKDPPAGHPAAQTGSSHVPASKDEREKVLGEGEQVIDKDSGVANSHADRGVNAATNY